MPLPCVTVTPRLAAIRRGDTLPDWIADVQEDGVGFDFTGWTLLVKMAGPVNFEGPAGGSADGVVTYPWADGNTDTPGTYQILIVGTKDGKRRTFPPCGDLTINVEPSW